MAKKENAEQAMLYKFIDKGIEPEINSFIKRQVSAMTPTEDKDIAPMTVRMPKTIVNMLKIKATLLDTSIQDLLVELVKKYLCEG